MLTTTTPSFALLPSDLYRSIIRQFSAWQLRRYSALPSIALRNLLTHLTSGLFHSLSPASPSCDCSENCAFAPPEPTGRLKKSGAPPARAPMTPHPMRICQSVMPVDCLSPFA